MNPRLPQTQTSQRPVKFRLKINRELFAALKQASAKLGLSPEKFVSNAVAEKIRVSQAASAAADGQ